MFPVNIHFYLKKEYCAMQKKIMNKDYEQTWNEIYLQTLTEMREELF